MSEYRYVHPADLELLREAKICLLSVWAENDVDEYSKEELDKAIRLIVKVIRSVRTK